MSKKPCDKHKCANPECTINPLHIGPHMRPEEYGGINISESEPLGIEEFRKKHPTVGAVALHELAKAFDDILWMAIRYAHGRRTSAPSTVRDACKIRAKYVPLIVRHDMTLDEIVDQDRPINCVGDDLRNLETQYPDIASPDEVVTFDL